MNNSVTQSLDDFIQRYIEAHQQQNHGLKTQWDEQWPSPCELGQPDPQGLIRWQPVKRHQQADFSATEQALEMVFHADIKTYYSSYWSEGLNASTARGGLQLLQAWNEDDFERLLQNLVGHVLMKRRLKQPETLFFAVTDDDDFIISLDNASGKVMLEQVGLEPKEVLAERLSEFLTKIEPQVQSV
ncbi:SecY-interacting protein [Lacimicrobium alkaliphilum]|uniref:Protein Syd n=1 Tax=Lacimicrobium alkaliphilum TaxID=1526571 RepID=A0A0U2Z493_9ALTE|nr:SecY-interacting protein [Lacimicrobium alkaliphilum]ALS97747.1 hypothetical protein AT746_05305 [Lacimicrobium alkaliphilum]